MKLKITILPILALVSLIFISTKVAGQNDSLTLAQAFVNLTLMNEKFDTIDAERASNILVYENKELTSITSNYLIDEDSQLLDFSWSLWYLAKSRHLSVTNSNTNRKELINWKNNLDQAGKYLYQVPDPVYEFAPFNQFINFSNESILNQWSRLYSLKEDFTPIFNKDIYPDFQRIFFTAIKKNNYYLDSLGYFCSLYNIHFSKSILDEQEGIYSNDYDYDENFYEYDLSVALDLISWYLQLDYIAKGKIVIIDTNSVYNAYYVFESNLIYYNRTEKDKFFIKYLNQKTCLKLLNEIQNRFPYNFEDDGIADSGVQPDLSDIDGGPYYFPIPAPFPTDKVAIKHFKPELKTLQQVDEHIRACFEQAGYKGRLHYFYIEEPGFAVTTEIERINSDASPASGTNRWDLKSSSNDELSLYNIFRLMFFSTEANYRLIACIVSAKEIETTNQPISMMDMSNLLKKSYSALPADLENQVLIDKTLTILLYYFTQSDVGKVPVLNRNTILTVDDHLKMTPTLTNLYN